MNPTVPTTASQLTPPGRGAVAVIAVQGPGAVESVSRFFQPASGRPVGSSPQGSIIFGRWGGPVGEEVIACHRADQLVEVHCHGGDAAARRLLADLAQAGCTQTRWQDAPTDAGPIEAEARETLTHAATLRASEILLDQLHGALRRELDNVLNALDTGDLATAKQTISSLLDRYAVGSRLARHWEVVLAGAPNAGKSSLMNALVGFDRAIVYDRPGTTRDAVSATTALDGWPVRLTDTAGLHTGGDTIEREGMAVAQRALASADLVLWVRDSTTTSREATEPPPGCPAEVLTVWTKSDLVEPQVRPATAEPVTSAVTGEGIAELLEAITHRLIPAAPPRGSGVPFAPRQALLLEEASRACDRGDTTEAAAAIARLG